MSFGDWQLNADAGALTAASNGWKSVSETAQSARDGFSTASTNALGSWTGDSADSFDESSSSAIKDMDEASSIATRISSALVHASGAVKAAQGHLDNSWAKLSGIARVGPLFFPKDAAEEDRIEAERKVANEIRSSLGAELDGCSQELADAVGSWNDLASRSRSKSDGTDPFVKGLPADSDNVGITLSGDQAVVTAGKGDNNITVETDPATNQQIVTIDGVSYAIPPGYSLTIRGGGGNDTITVPEGSSVGFTLSGGAGDDRINGGGSGDRIFGGVGNDEIKAGGGNDYVSGGSGNDYMDGQDGDDRMFGGSGRDTLYGLNGDDRLSGGDDQDYLEGGKGEDMLYGGSGNDVLSGGRGDDKIFGGAGDDVSYGGLGSDVAIGGGGADTSYDDSPAKGSSNEKDVTVEIPEDTPFVKVEGSKEFVERTEADLDMLRASPTGQRQLGSLQASHDLSALFGREKTLTISEYQQRNPDDYNSKARASPDGDHYEVEYLPTFDDFRGGPPVVVLQHELGHVHDFTYGTFRDENYSGDATEDHGVKVAERQATGLPIDHDNDPNTPEVIDPKHPLQYTENGLRKEMGLPKRESYK